MLGQKPEEDAPAANGEVTEGDEDAEPEAEAVPAGGSDKRPKRDLKKIK